MAAKKASRPQPDAFEVYCYAVTYKMSTERLGEQKPTRPYIIPAAVFEALALEVFFKCLYRIKRKDIPEHHDLKELFERLDDADKKSASNKFDAIVMVNDGNKHKLTLPGVLDRCKNFFEVMRYGYEASLSADQAAVVPLNLGLWSAVEAVQSLILDAEPTFAARAEADLQ